MTTITATRTAELHAALAAQRTNEHMGANPKPYPASMTTFYELGKQRAAETLTWAEIQALANASEADKAAMVGTEIEPAGATWANVTQVRAYCVGVLEVHDALRATAKGSNPRGHTL